MLAALVAGPDGLFANDGESRRCLLAAARKQFNTTKRTKPCEAMLMPANAPRSGTHTQMGYAARTGASQTNRAWTSLTAICIQ